MKFLIFVLAIISVCAAQSDEDWDRFQSKYGKSYRSVDEVTNRRAIWEKNWNKIKDHNRKYAQGYYTYTLGENQFADMTYEEFSQQYLGLNPKSSANREEHQMSGRANAKAYDLRSQGWVTPVRDQGKCGGCWAFASAATAEVLYRRVKGPIAGDEYFSPQFLIQCSKGMLLGIIQRNKGCSGGQLLSTYDDMKSIGNQLESKFPYIAADAPCPSATSYTKGYTVNGGVAVSTEQAIVDAVESGNAVSIGIHASDRFQLYKEGIYHGNSTENSAGLNHAVVVVGYDINDKGAEFYHIRNSWSEKWGEKGYFRLRYGEKHLGITQMASYPKF